MGKFSFIMLVLASQAAIAQDVRQPPTILPVESNRPLSIMAEPDALRDQAPAEGLRAQSVFARFELPEQNFNFNVDSKKNTLYFLNATGGYGSYDVYGSWIRAGRSYHSHFEFAQPCAVGFVPQQHYGLLNATGALAIGLIGNALDMPQKWKVGKGFTICIR